MKNVIKKLILLFLPVILLIPFVSADAEIFGLTSVQNLTVDNVFNANGESTMYNLTLLGFLDLFYNPIYNVSYINSTIFYQNDSPVVDDSSLFGGEISGNRTNILVDPLFIRNTNESWALEAAETNITLWFSDNLTEIKLWISTNESDDIDNTNTSWAIASITTEVTGWMTGNMSDVSTWISTNESDDIDNANTSWALESVSTEIAGWISGNESDDLTTATAWAGDLSGTGTVPTVINTQGISGYNITAGIVADTNIADSIARDTEIVQNCSEANSCDNIAYDTEVNTLLAANMSVIDGWITTNESDDMNVSTQFGGEVSGTYDNLALGNDALDDQYYELTDVVGNTTAEIQSQFGAGEYINITSGVIEVNMSPLVTYLNTVYRTLTDVQNATAQFGGEVSGTYDNLVLGNDALDDQYYELTDVVGNTTAEIQSQFGAGEYINITSGVIEVNMSPTVAYLNTVYRTLADVLNATSNFGGDASGTYDAISVIDTAGLGGENITTGMVLDTWVDDNLTINTENKIDVQSNITVIGSTGTNFTWYVEAGNFLFKKN